MNTSYKLGISAIILTKNEEKNIVDCLESLSFVDEIIVIDDYSKDRTTEVAENFNPRIKIFQRALGGNFSEQRNFGLSKAKKEWVLFIDADERISSGLKEEITNFIKSDDQTFQGFELERRDILWGKQLKHGETGNIKIIRFAKKNAGKWTGKVHEIWNIKEQIGTLKMPLYHYPHQSIEEFLREINFYTDLRAKELYEKNVRVNFLKIIFYPKAKFLLNYFLKLGFWDGVEGLIFAIMMSFHSFLVRGKLWMLWQKK